MECARKARVEGAAEFLESDDKGVKEVSIQGPICCIRFPRPKYVYIWFTVGQGRA